MPLKRHYAPAFISPYCPANVPPNLEPSSGKLKHPATCTDPMVGLVNLGDLSQEILGSYIQCFLPFSLPPELQTMVEHHLGQQKQGEEPEGATESTGNQESCPPGIPDTGSASRPDTPGTAQSMYNPGRVTECSSPALQEDSFTHWGIGRNHSLRGWNNS